MPLARAPETKLSVEQAFAWAYERQKTGALDEARPVYEHILGTLPHHGRSLTMLASIAYQTGHDVQADAYLDRAIGLHRADVDRNPANSGAQAQLVNLLLARGRDTEAEHFAEHLSLELVPVRATPEAFQRRRAAAQDRGLPPILINTIPKSASESIWNKLAEGLGLAQAHISIGLFPDCTIIPSRIGMLSRGGLITKEHLPANRYNLKMLSGHGIDRLVFHVRDPRQATLSWAHFVRDDVSSRLLGPLWRKIVPPAHVVCGDMSEVIDWCLDSYLPLLIDFLARWREVQADPGQPLSVQFMSFETFRIDPDHYFDEVLDFYGIARDDFAAEAEAEVVHLRKGQLDEWRGVFTEAQRHRAWELIPQDIAEAFGWQP